MTHTSLMANSLNNDLSHTSLHHRHLDGVGLSIFQAFQTFRSGMPKVVRVNLNIALLFPNCDLGEIQIMHQELCNNISFETFKEIFLDATEERHGFLMIDKTASDPAKQFRKGFDTYYVINPGYERRKLLGCLHEGEKPFDSVISDDRSGDVPSRHQPPERK